MELKFYKCAGCGKIVAVVKPSACPTKCCGEAMEEMIPGATDGAHEKHVPVCTVENGIAHVEVGSVLHPMMDAHYIEWIALQTKKGYQIADLKPGDEPKADFAIAPGDEAEAAFAYCNLHGFWKG